ncbi:MAG TPA: trehalose-6-phosphate synthase [Pseudonocardiaceae bacterium]|jgi:trehalose-6-phosphate synthase/hydroxymethylpyrimidine pyrophosphatase-like HAD family hydrolase|nr:trehalose-6-phosphate synthase [Pseudonocardiaceae bacterium]
MTEAAARSPDTPAFTGEGSCAKILAADLDGTLLGGDVTDRWRLHAALARYPEVTVVFATGRGLSAVREALRDRLLPRPRWIIADIGATVLDGSDLSPVEPLQTQLRTGWPGTERVRAALGRFPALKYQDDVDQDGRCSFYLPRDQLTTDITDAVAALGCRWIYSADRYFDVLPPGASKGSALLNLARQQGWSMDAILVAGDSLNDLSLFTLGARGVIVGNAEPALSSAVPTREAVYRPPQPGAAGVLQALESLGWVQTRYPLVVGYHRPPVSWKPRLGWHKPQSPNGILPTLNHLFTSNLDAIWVTGGIIDTEEHLAHLNEHDTGIPLSFVPLAPHLWSGYFHRACKETLWPILMSQPERMRFDPAAWVHYRSVNERFARHIANTAGPRATVWLHDYNLWLVPGLLRTTRPDLKIGLFHHTPFPPPDAFTALPTAAEIRTSLGCLDWAGFHTSTFAQRFRHVVAKTPRPPRIGVHPLGIDRKAIETLARTRAPHRQPRTGPLVVSIERLDYVKAPLEKVEAIAGLLSGQPELRRQLRFRLVCAPPEPGITAYDPTKQQLERRIAQINQTWSVAGWQPIEYSPHTLSFTEVIDNYLAADVFWVTSYQDGMNLTAKEFIAAQAAVAGFGVLVLSHHTGAAEQLGTAALLTDPHSRKDLIDKLRLALMLSKKERQTRLRRLADLLGDHPPSAWASQIITAIQDA